VCTYLRDLPSSVFGVGVDAGRRRSVDVELTGKKRKVDSSEGCDCRMVGDQLQAEDCVLVALEHMCRDE